MPLRQGCRKDRLIGARRADLERAAAQHGSANSLKLLRQARERLGDGLRAAGAGNIAESGEISLRNRNSPPPAAGSRRRSLRRPAKSPASAGAPGADNLMRCNLKPRAGQDLAGCRQHGRNC